MQLQKAFPDFQLLKKADFSKVSKNDDFFHDYFPYEGETVVSGKKKINNYKMLRVMDHTRILETTW
jgi:hypothetical protein